MVNKYFLISNFSVNFPVVTGGFALLAAFGQTQTSAGLIGVSALPAVFTPSYLGGAAGLLGNFGINWWHI